jgi:hypothetical protein
MTDYRIHAATLNTTKLPGCTGYAVEVGRQVMMRGTSGSAHRRLVSAARYAQGISLQTSGLKTLLDMMLVPASAPIPCASLATLGAGLQLATVAQNAVLPTDTAGAAELMTIARGLICFRGVSWGQVGDAVAVDVGVWPLSADGQSSAWSIAQGAIPGLPTTEETYTLHSITWKGSAVDGVNGLSLTMGTSPQVEYNPGAIYPAFIRQAPATGNIAVEATFAVPDRNLLRTYGEHFHGAAAGDLVMKFRPFLHAAARAATEVTFTLTGVAEVTGAADGNPSGAQITVHGVKTDGTSPLAWA